MVSNTYLQQILPLINKTEKLLKKEITNSIIRGKSYQETQMSLRLIIDQHFLANFPKNSGIDSKEYVNGLWYSANKWYDTTKKQHDAYRKVLNSLFVLNIVNYTTQELIEDKDISEYEMIVDFYNDLDKIIFDLSKDIPTTAFDVDNPRHPLSLRTKLNADINLLKQQDMINECYKSGKDLFRLSYHLGASKRCKPFQGKVVSLSLHSTKPNFATDTLTDDNEIIYSFIDITNQIDQYGYKNNIIVGFNCRHRLIPYKPNMKLEDHEDIRDNKSEKEQEFISKLEYEILIYKIASNITFLEKYKEMYKNKVKSLMNKLFAYIRKHKLDIEWWKINI